MRLVSSPVWTQGIEPKHMSPDACRQVLSLFLKETGEQYSDASVRHLPIPNWEGNLILKEETQSDESPIIGLLWATPFMDDIVRVAAFVIHSERQGSGLGSEASWMLPSRQDTSAFNLKSKPPIRGLNDFINGAV